MKTAISSAIIALVPSIGVAQSVTIDSAAIPGPIEPPIVQQLPAPPYDIRLYNDALNIQIDVDNNTIQIVDNDAGRTLTASVTTIFDGTSTIEAIEIEYANGVSATSLLELLPDNSARLTYVAPPPLDQAFAADPVFIFDPSDQQGVVDAFTVTYGIGFDPTTELAGWWWKVPGIGVIGIGAKVAACEATAYHLYDIANADCSAFGCPPDWVAVCEDCTWHEMLSDALNCASHFGFYDPEAADYDRCFATGCP